jgi:hypothetical protein
MNESLEILLRDIKTIGKMGIVVWPQGDEYIAACIGRDGSICDPRNWDTMPTPEAAIDDLAERVSRLAAGMPSVAK